MSLQENVVDGTLKEDGTLELDEKPSLAPGRVTVVLRQHAEPAPLKEDWWQFMQRSRRELEAADSPFMTEQELNAHIDWLREEDHIDQMLRQTDTTPLPQERP